MPFSFGEKPLNQGQVVSVMCTVVEGDNPLSLKWTLNGGVINNGENGVTLVPIGDKNIILTVASVGAENVGNYSCSANNSAGFDSKSSSLNVNGDNLVKPVMCFECLYFNFFFTWLKKFYIDFFFIQAFLFLYQIIHFSSCTPYNSVLLG